jgi:hypothetical protein
MILLNDRYVLYCSHAGPASSVRNCTCDSVPFRFSHQSSRNLSKWFNDFASNTKDTAMYKYTAWRINFDFGR